MFIHNSWYVACWAHEIGQGPVGREILEQPVVLFRTESGELAALEDRCPHRHLQLSMGHVVGETIQCAYHGMQIDGAGRCAHVPSQKAIPPRARIRSYPVEERYGWVWIWPGDPARADAALIPDFGQLVDPKLKAVGSTNHVQASYQLLNDNLLDLSHVGFVHTSTIGNREFGANAKISVEKEGTGVRVTRWVRDCPPPPTYVKTGHLPEGRNIDRWSIIHYTPPGFCIIHTGGAEVGTGAPEGRLDHGINLWVMNAMTPQNARTTHYFWATVRNFRIDDPAADDLIFTQVKQAFEEDKHILEAQQISIDRHGDDWANALQADAGAVEGRRCLEKMMKAETGEAVIRDASCA
ncbi:MAG: Rieske 2Fe-2S domain-containing protein [Sphingobium sp.]